MRPPRMLMIDTVDVPTWVSAGQLTLELVSVQRGTAAGLTDSPGGRSTRTSCRESKLEVLTLNWVIASAGCEPAWVAYWLGVGGLDGLRVLTTPAWKLVTSDAACAGAAASSITQ